MGGASVEKPSSVLRPQYEQDRVVRGQQSAAVSGVPVFGFGSETVPFGRCGATSFGNGRTLFAGSNVISPASTMLNVQIDRDRPCGESRAAPWRAPQDRIVDAGGARSSVSARPVCSSSFACGSVLRPTE